MKDLIQSITIVAPIAFVLAVGFWSIKRQFFPEEKQDATIATINKIVMDLGLPCGLFVATASVSRSQLFADGWLTLALLLTLIIGYFVGYFIVKLLFRQGPVESILAGIAVCFAAGPFFGPALLEGVYGTENAVTIGIIALLLNVVIIPISSIMLQVTHPDNKGKITSFGALLEHAIVKAIFKTPYVVAPLIGLVLVLCNFKTPDIIINSLSLLGGITSALAILVAGMNLAKHQFKLTGEVVLIVLLKNIAFPALFVLLCVFLGVHRSGVQYDQMLLLTALPSGPLIVLLSTKYKIYQQESASILILSTLSTLVVTTGLLYLLHL